MQRAHRMHPFLGANSVFRFRCRSHESPCRAAAVGSKTKGNFDFSCSLQATANFEDPSEYSPRKEQLSDFDEGRKASSDVKLMPTIGDLENHGILRSEDLNLLPQNPTQIRWQKTGEANVISRVHSVADPDGQRGKPDDGRSPRAMRPHSLHLFLYFDLGCSRAFHCVLFDLIACR